MAPRRLLRMLVFTRETFPTFRVDLEKLFGKELIGRGHKIDFVMQASSPLISAGPTPWRGRTVWVGAAAAGSHFLQRAGAHLQSFAHDFACLMRLARQEHYDAIQVRNKFLIAAFASFLAQQRGLLFFYWLSFPLPESQLKSGQEGTARFPLVNRLRGRVFGWLLYRVILPRCDHIFVQSERMKEDLRAQGVDPGKMTPIPMGIDPNDFPVVKRSTPAERAGGPTFVLGYLGTLSAQRRLEILVDTLALLCARGIDSRLLMVGGSDNPQDVANLEARARQLRVSGRIEITGLLPREQALERMMAVDVALSPYFPTMILQSTSPTKLVEYMALGLPVIANRHPEQQLILRLSHAGVCVPWGARHFARASCFLARLGPEKRREYGQRGREWVIRNRGYPGIADVLERTYLEILRQRTNTG